MNKFLGFLVLNTIIIITVVGATLKINNLSTTSWWFIFAPVYVPIAIILTFALIGAILITIEEASEQRKRDKEELEQKEREEILMAKFNADREQYRKEVEHAEYICSKYNVTYNTWSKTFTDVDCNTYIVDENDKLIKLN